MEQSSKKLKKTYSIDKELVDFIESYSIKLGSVSHSFTLDKILRKGMENISELIQIDSRYQDSFVKIEEKLNQIQEKINGSERK